MDSIMSCLVDTVRRLAMLYPMSLYLPLTKEFSESKTYFNNFVKSAFEQRKQEDPNKNSERGLDFLDMIMKSNETEKNEKFALSNLGLFLIAGHDSYENPKLKSMNESSAYCHSVS